MSMNDFWNRYEPQDQVKTGAEGFWAKYGMEDEVQEEARQKAIRAEAKRKKEAEQKSREEFSRNLKERQIVGDYDPALADVKESFADKAQRLSGTAGIGLLKGATQIGALGADLAMAPYDLVMSKVNPNYEHNPYENIFPRSKAFEGTFEETLAPTREAIGSKGTTGESIIEGLTEFVPSIALSGGLTKATGLLPTIEKAGATAEKALGGKLLGKGANAVVKTSPDMVNTWMMMEAPKREEDRIPFPEWAAMWAGTELGMKGLGAGVKAGVGKLGKARNRPTLDELMNDLGDDLFSEAKTAQVMPERLALSGGEQPLALTAGTNWKNPTPYETAMALEKQRMKALSGADEPLALPEGYYPDWDMPSPYETFKALEGQKPKALLGAKEPLALPESKIPNWELYNAPRFQGTSDGKMIDSLEGQFPLTKVDGVNYSANTGLKGKQRIFTDADPSIPRSDIGDPAYLASQEKRYNKIIGEEVTRMKDELGGVVKYMPDEMNGPLMRASLNPQWYRDFWKKNARAPREGEFRDMAIKHLTEGVETNEGAFPANDEFLGILSELSRGQKLPEEWHGLQKSMRDMGDTPELKGLTSDMKAEQAKVEPYGLTKDIDRLTEMENQARKNMADRATDREMWSQVGSVGKSKYNPMDDLKDLATIGASKIARKGLEFKEWADEMVAEFGEIIRTKLGDIWEQSKAILGDESGRVGKPSAPPNDAVQANLNRIAEIVNATAERIPKGMSYSTFSQEMLARYPKTEKVLPYMWEQAQQLSKKGKAEVRFKDNVVPLKKGQDNVKATDEPTINDDYNTAQSINSYDEIKDSVNIPETAKLAYRKVVDNLNRLNDVDNYMKKATGKGLSEGDKLYIKGMNSRSSGGIAQQIMEKHMLDFEGNPIGDSFWSVIKKATDVVGKDWKAFEDYGKLKHSASWMRLGRDVYPEEAGLGEPVKRIKQTWEQIDKIKADKTLNAEQKNHVISQLEADIESVTQAIRERFIEPRMARLEQQYPEIANAQQEYATWINQFVDEWAVKPGLISKEEWTALQREFPDYVPLQRVMDKVEEGMNFPGAGFANQKKPIKKGRGSERNTIESVEVMLERIPQYVTEAKRNEVAQNLYKMMQKNPEDMEVWGKIVTVKPGDPINPNIVTARVDGKEVSMELNDPALLDAMAKLSKEGQGVVTKLAREATGIMKTLTTGVNPFFSVGRNVFYDTPQAFINSKTLSNVKGINNPIQFSVDLVDSLIRLVTNEKWHKDKYLQMYRDMGGGQFSSASADRNLMAETKAKIMPNYYDASKPLKSAGRGVKEGYGNLQKLMSVTETLPRLPEFKRSVQQGGGTYDSKVKGLYEANDISFNFSRHGDVSKFVDAYVPYFNAAIQGIDRVNRAFKDNPIGATGNAIISVTVPTLMLYSLNHDNPDYQKLSEATKSRYYCIPKGDGKFVKIVKPRESGTVFGTAIEDVLDFIEKDDPKVFDSLMTGIEMNFAPPYRPLWAPATTDLIANKDFAGRPIVPGYLAGNSKKNQHDSRTSEPAKWLGDKLNASPKKIDYVARNYTGIVGQLGQPLTTEGVGLSETVSRQFTADPVYSNDVFSNFYDELTKLNEAHKDVKAGFPNKDNDDAKYTAMNRVSRELSDKRKEIRKVEADKTMDAKKKQDVLRQMQAEMVDIADKALKGEYGKKQYKNLWN